MQYTVIIAGDNKPLFVRLVELCISLSVNGLACSSSARFAAGLSLLLHSRSSFLN